MHPFAPDFSTISDADLQKAITELGKKILAASRHNSGALGQMQMLYQDYLEENGRREQVKLEEMIKANKQDFDGIIDIG